jgi:acetyl-CoA C-acetyltransferase
VGEPDPLLGAFHPRGLRPALGTEKVHGLRPSLWLAMPSPPRVAIVGAARTPIGRFGGGLHKVPSVELGKVAAAEALKRAGVPAKKIDETLFGLCIAAGVGQNPARQVALGVGVPVDRGALTVNMVCGSGMRSLLLAATEIRAGDIDIALVGGMESMSRAPHLYPRVRAGVRYGDAPGVDAIARDSLEDAYGHGLMGRTADLSAKRLEISREEQDKFALRSHQRAQAATQEGRLKDEIVPVPEAVTQGPAVERDEGIRGDTTLEKLAKLKAAFTNDGTVTPGNASQMSDGAAALVLASEAKVKKLGLTPMAWIRSSFIGGVEPVRITESPIPTVRAHLEKEKLKVSEIDLIEANEAFAVASVAFQRELGVPEDRLNVNGGAIALGHPIGCSGARIVVTLLHELRRRKAGRGLATLCMGGGNGLSLLVEAP